MLCLPGCGVHLSILNPFEVPGYDDFTSMVDEASLEKISKYAIKTVGEQTYTQLGQTAIFKNEEKTFDACEKTDDGGATMANEEPEEPASIALTQDNIDSMNIIEQMFSDLTNANSFCDLLKEEPFVDQTSDVAHHENNKRIAEIESISKELMMTSELAGKDINAPCYKTITPIFRRKSKNDMTLTKTAEKVEKTKRRRRKCQKQLTTEMNDEEQKTESIPIEKRKKAPRKGKGKEIAEKEESDKKQDEGAQGNGDAEEGESLEGGSTEKIEKDHKGEEENRLKASSSVASLTEEFLEELTQNNTHKIDDPPSQQLDELQVEDVDQVLGMIDPKNDILSHTFLSTPERRKLIEKPTQEESESINAGASEVIEDIASACLPNAYDLWKDKYRSLVEEEYPNATNREIENQLRELWCKIPDEHRQRYYNKADKLVRRYNSSAAFSYMNRFKCKSSAYPKRGYGIKDYPSLITPTAVRVKKTDSDIQMNEGSEEEFDAGNDEISSTSFDFTMAMKETMFNSPSDKDLSKKLGQMMESQNLGGGKEVMTFTDENAIATGVLMDIMMGEQPKTGVEDEEQLTSMWDQAADGAMDLMKDESLDISGLDDYLSGKGDDSFIEEKVKKRRVRKKKKKTEEEGDAKNYANVVVK